MKRILCPLLSCLVLSLSACGVPQSDYDALVEENSSLQAQVESLQYELETLSNENESEKLTSSNMDFEEFFEVANEEAEKLASESKEITSGEFYDSVSDVYSDVSIIELGSNVSISVFIEHKTELEDSIVFFDVINQIIETSKLENYYSGATFMMFIDKSLVTILSVLNYTSSSSFTSTEPIIIKDEYEESIETLYSIGFSSNDVSNNFDNYIDELREEYNLPN